MSGTKAELVERLSNLADGAGADSVTGADGGADSDNFGAASARASANSAVHTPPASTAAPAGGGLLYGLDSWRRLVVIEVVVVVGDK